jgi:hypothetical protein
MTEKISWESEIITIDHQSGIKYPAFHWGCPGGDVYALPDRDGKFLFRDRSNGREEPSLKLNRENLLEELATYGWEIPPHIEIVEKDVKEASKILNENGHEKFLEYCSDMKKRWEALLPKTSNA